MKIYLIYAAIDSEDFLTRMCHLVPDKNIYKLNDDETKFIGLYAFTNKKNVMKEFIKSRNHADYIVNREELDDDSYESFKVNNIQLHLDYYKFGDTTMVATKNEYVQITDYLSENMYEFIQCATVDYYIFNNDIMDALDKISYTTAYDTTLVSGENDFYNDRLSQADNNASYGLTVNGQPLHLFEDNVEMCFLYIFKPMFSSSIKKDGDNG